MKYLIAILALAAASGARCDYIQGEPAKVRYVPVRKAERVQSPEERKWRNLAYTRGKENVALVDKARKEGAALKQSNESLAKEAQTLKLENAKLKVQYETLGKWGVKWQSYAQDLEAKWKKWSGRFWQCVFFFGGILFVIGLLIGIMVPKGNGTVIRVSRSPEAVTLPEVIEPTKADKATVAAVSEAYAGAPAPTYTGSGKITVKKKRTSERKKKSPTK